MQGSGQTDEDFKKEDNGIYCGGSLFNKSDESDKTQHHVIKILTRVVILEVHF